MDTKGYRILGYHKSVLRTAWGRTVYDLFGEIQNLVGDFVIAVASGLAYAFWTYFKQGAMIDWLGVVIAVIVGFIAWSIVLFLINLFFKVPAKMFMEKDKEASKFNWDYITIEKAEVKDNETFMAHGILFKNDKAYDLRRIIAQIQYFEIDGKSYVEDRQLLQTQKGRRLGWLWNDHRISVTEQSLDKNGGGAVVDLFRIMPNQFSFFEFSSEENSFQARDIDVKEHVRGEILFLASYGIDPDEWIPIENIYNFTITVKPNKEPIMIFGKGRIYKPPEVER